MKNTLLLTIPFLFFTLFTNAQDFITTWNVGHNFNSLFFEATTSGDVNYTWQSTTTSASGSGTFQGSDVTITGLPAETIITLSIAPENLKSFKNNFQLIEVNQWGAVEWETSEDAFINANVTVSATDIPDLSNCTSLKNMFAGNFNFNSAFNINFWDISNVTDLSGMFQGCFYFNQALSQWGTSNVTNMSSMFEGARFFNQNVGSWDTANVTNMSKMFKNASAFDRNISNWNTGNVTDMSEMFSGDINSGFQSEFNKNIGSWNTSNVIDMSGMFSAAVNFNQNIGNWDTSNVTNMSKMFNFALVFDQNIGNWNTSNVTDMSEMFKRETLFFENDLPDGSAFNNGGIPSIENWNTANVVDMTDMFAQATSFNHNLENWSLNEDVVLVGMLDEAGLDCNNYSITLIGWSNNPNTPDDKILGATFLEYGPEAVTAINNLVLNKGWGFSGHDILSTIPDFTINNVYCEADDIPPLPTTSDDGINGSWSPDLDANETTTYTFTPNDGECAIETTLTISIEPNIQPTFEDVPAICEGESLPALPTLSQNGISGTWSPALNNTETTTYSFTPNEGQCANTVTLTIGVNPIDESNIPSFQPVSDICIGEELSDLPTTSENGITGSWSPAINNTETTTYTFTPDDGQCAGTATLSINVVEIESPTGSEEQVVASGSTLNDLDISPATIVWYASFEDAVADVNPLPSNTSLDNDTFYYAVNDNGLCRSDPFEVKVFITLSVVNNEFESLNYYPNPVANTLYISNSEPIKQVAVYNLVGQLLVQQQVNESEFSLDLNELPQSIYIVKLETEKQNINFQVIKP
jgi:surface protein